MTKEFLEDVGCALLIFLLAMALIFFGGTPMEAKEITKPEAHSDKEHHSVQEPRRENDGRDSMDVWVANIDHRF